MFVLLIILPHVCMYVLLFGYHIIRLSFLLCDVFLFVFCENVHAFVCVCETFSILCERVCVADKHTLQNPLLHRF